MNKEYQDLLKQYGKKAGDKYMIGVLVLDVYGYVWLRDEIKPLHYVGHISTLQELKEVCNIWNDKQLEEYE